MSEKVVRKTYRPKVVKQYYCGNDNRMCGIETPNAEICRRGCPFLHIRRDAQDLANVLKMERRLVEFEKVFDEVIKKWTDKKVESIARGRLNDAYIYRNIVELLCEPDLKVAQKKLSSRIMAVKLPLFRSFYKDAREDVKRLRLIVKNHQKFLKAREELERRGGTVPAREEACRVVQTERGDEAGTIGAVEVLPGEEISPC